MAAVPTERIARPAPSEASNEPDVIEKGVLIGRSTLAGLCLTAFACGIITTVAIGHGHAPAVVAQQAAQATVEHQAAAEQAPSVPAPANSAPAVAAAVPAPADPLVVQMASAAPAAEPERAV
ncbi:MAG TPA: hypothetical protein VHM31_12095, partial [Polyangia bacterium]|nr:hypothetical protein [Polyangia bacterium]